MYPRLLLLDALRGVAALIVLWYHCYEGFGYEVAAGSGIYTQPCDHGYLAVDFFFLLSGFVIGYAYDQRWKKGLTTGQFALRRLIRLHPMVIAGAVLGLVTFLIQGGVDWSGNHASPGWITIAFMMALFLVPCWPGFGADVRGNGEMYPLNGPHWSLFFEYIGNVLYALLLRRLPTALLALLTLVSGLALAYSVLRLGYLGVGWSFIDGGFGWGMIRMLFPYCLGMLMARRFMRLKATRPSASPGKVRLTFLITAAALLVTLPVPFVGSPLQPWQNGLYIITLLVIVFPLVVWFAARAGSSDSKVARFFGDISYPLYTVHYPFMYLFYAYIGFPDTHGTMADVWPVALALVAFNILLAWLLMKFYDLPLRRRLSQKLLR